MNSELSPQDRELVAHIAEHAAPPELSSARQMAFTEGLEARLARVRGPRFKSWHAAGAALVGACAILFLLFWWNPGQASSEHGQSTEPGITGQGVVQETASLGTDPPTGLRQVQLEPEMELLITQPIINMNAMMPLEYQGLSHLAVEL